MNDSINNYNYQRNLKGWNLVEITFIMTRHKFRIGEDYRYVLNFPNSTLLDYTYYTVITEIV